MRWKLHFQIFEYWILKNIICDQYKSLNYFNWKVLFHSLRNIAIGYIWILLTQKNFCWSMWSHKDLSIFLHLERLSLSTSLRMLSIRWENLNMKTFMFSLLSGTVPSLYISKLVLKKNKLLVNTKTYLILMINKRKRH